MLESVGPELRQYIVASNDEERPFSRDQRRWVYASSKRQINTFGFGTDNDYEQSEALVVFKQSPFPRDAPAKGEPGAAPDYALPAGEGAGRCPPPRAARSAPPSLVNISGMSYGSLSPVAVQALNRGAALAGCLHNTGEGGLADAHRYGGELIFQIGTGYFGCRDEHGRFSLERLCQRLQEAPVRAIEIKLSQGAKPGLGGLLPAAKVTEEIARIRGVPAYRDCASPSVAFRVHRRRRPDRVRRAHRRRHRTAGRHQVGGRRRRLLGASSPRAWPRPAAGPTSSPSTAARAGPEPRRSPSATTSRCRSSSRIARVYPVFARAGIAEDVVFIGAGRLGFPDAALHALALGCDMINVGREAMLADRLHPGPALPHRRLPDRRRHPQPLADARPGPDIKRARAANYIVALRAELLSLARACGARHPALMRPDRIEIISAARTRPRRCASSSATSPSGRCLRRPPRRGQRARSAAGAPAGARTRGRRARRLPRRRRPFARPHGRAQPRRDRRAKRADPTPASGRMPYATRRLRPEISSAPPGSVSLARARGPHTGASLLGSRPSTDSAACRTVAPRALSGCSPGILSTQVYGQAGSSSTSIRTPPK